MLQPRRGQRQLVPLSIEQRVVAPVVDGGGVRASLQQKVRDGQRLVVFSATGILCGICEARMSAVHCFLVSCRCTSIMRRTVEAEHGAQPLQRLPRRRAAVPAGRAVVLLQRVPDAGVGAGWVLAGLPEELEEQAVSCFLEYREHSLDI